ncbi:hypothetical protein [Kozakia baliensis]|uniref:Uncharacterized protein n=1 Tax=Kozakia baliensis TaxID=153496 RepID=A0A1D8UXR6_9PROT|nr:hypothetical protein [Kozakia baliensis]AOX18409.1 hypothetical protein A0U89_13905 [Kozakia baliensis]GBR34114.1 hypothetical protein AA0488_2822 [Kozakia baliensis NRIC 0488]GEL65150.1 hypothetical protein KBA01_24360 [Kozakia baliensis]
MSPDHTVPIAEISKATLTLLREIKKPLTINDPAGGRDTKIPWEEACLAEAYLPVVLLAAEAVWVDITGTGFDLDIRETPGTTVGYTLQGIRGATYSVIMLCVIDVLEALGSGQDEMVLNDLIEIWVNGHSNHGSAPGIMQGAE